MKKAVQFGAGNIGRGFIAQLLSESGFEVVFADVVDAVVENINARHTYPIRYAAPGSPTTWVKNVRAVNSKVPENAAREIADADLMCTAVGVNVLPYVAPVIALGIKARYDAGVTEPINIIICENLQHMGAFLKGEVKKHLDESLYGYLDEKVGFVESVVGRMVPVMTPEQKAEDPLLSIVEPYKHLPVAKSMIKGDFPEIVGIEPKDNFQGYVDRKLYTHNAGHAAAAYLGNLKGYTYIYEAMRDPEVAATVREIMNETGEGLIKKHGLDRAEHMAHIDDLIERFGNVALADTVKRVGGDPLRKLRHEDRLVGGALLAREYGVFPKAMCKAIAAALVFNPEGDPTAAQVQSLIAEKGAKAAFCEISGVDEGDSIVDEIMKNYNNIKS